MLVDARFIRPGHAFSADICIIGGGAAGITIARELWGLGCRVVVLESGDLQASKEAQALNEGVVGGSSHAALDVHRIRALGGSTHVWGGWARPLDTADFEARDWIPHSGWPFGREHLDPFYRRAHSLCGLGAYDYSVARWRGELRVHPSSAADALTREIVFQIAPTRFGDVHSGLLRSADDIQVILRV